MFSLKKIFQLNPGASLDDGYEVPVSEGPSSGQVKKYNIGQLKLFIWAYVQQQITGITKGDKGDTGLKGDQGSQGIQGIQGPKGDKGDTGLKGDKGDQGIQGIQGPKGDKGDKGDQGIQGFQGIQGPKGDKGDKGDPAIALSYVYSHDDIDSEGNIDVSENITGGASWLIGVRINNEPIPDTFYYPLTAKVSGFGGWIGITGLTIEITFI